MKSRSILFFVLIFVITLSSIYSQEKPLPQWLQMEQGIKAYDEGRLGEALRIFRNIAEEDPLYANVHMWLGHVFAAEGEYISAKEKYYDALEKNRNFFPQSERINALYSLVEIARRLEEWDEMETHLRAILKEGKTEPLPEVRVEAMLNKFISEGPDKLLELYRLKDKPIREAYETLGILSLQKENYRGAMKNLLLSITTSLSIAIDVHHSLDPEYSFINYDMNPGLERFFTENTALLLNDSRRVTQLEEYFNTVGLHRQLFLLGMSMLGMGEKEKAERIWLLVTEYQRAGKWANLARSQIGEASLDILPTVLNYR